MAANGLKPHLVRTFKVSNDPHFVEKLVDVVLVLEVDAGRGAEQALETLGAHERRRPPQAQDVEDLARDVDPGLTRDFLGDQRPSGTRREVVGTDRRLGSGMQRRLQRLRHHRGDVEPCGGHRIGRQVEAHVSFLFCRGTAVSSRTSRHGIVGPHEGLTHEHGVEARRSPSGASSTERIEPSATATISGMRIGQRSPDKVFANVARSRSFTPMTCGSMSTARSISAVVRFDQDGQPEPERRSCRSESKPSSEIAATISKIASAPIDAGLAALHLVDGEVLAQDGKVRGTPPPLQVGECRRKRARSVSTDRPRRHLRRTPGRCRRLDVGGQLPFGRRTPFDLPDNHDPPSAPPNAPTKSRAGRGSAPAAASDRRPGRKPVTSSPLVGRISSRIVTMATSVPGIARHGAPQCVPASGVTGKSRLSLGLTIDMTVVAFEALAVATVAPAGGARARRSRSLRMDVQHAFMLASLVGTVVAGHATDRHGPAPPYLAGVGLFTIGLIACGVARRCRSSWSVGAIQGVGAGALGSIAYITATVGRAFSEEERPRQFAILSSAWVIPGLITPGFGGLVAEHLGWRFVFLGLAALLPPSPRCSCGRNSGASAWPPTTGADVAGETGSAPEAALPIPGRPGARDTGTGRDRRGAGQLVDRRRAPARARRCGHRGPGLPPPDPTAGRCGRHAACPPPSRHRSIEATFTFFGTDTFLAFTLADVRHLSTVEVGLALTPTTITWTIEQAWIQARTTTRHSRTRRPASASC